MRKKTAFAQKLSEKRETNLLFTNFKKEIKLVKISLLKNASLQDYFTRNLLFELKENARKEERKLLIWLNKLIEAQKEYFQLL
jgi:hypothetical protein